MVISLILHTPNPFLDNLFGIKSIVGKKIKENGNFKQFNRKNDVEINLFININQYQSINQFYIF